MDEMKNIFSQLNLKMLSDDEERELEEEEKRQSELKSLENFKNCGIGLAYFDCDFSNYKIESPEQQEILEKAREYFRLIRSGRKTNMILNGNAGEGKTHVVAALLKQFCRAVKTEKVNGYELKSNYSVHYTSSKDLCDVYSRTQVFNSGYSTCSFYTDFVKSYDILAIDEVGKAISKNEWEIIFDVLDKRMQNKKSTILVSNLPYEQLNASLGDYGMSRLNIDGNLIKVDTTGLPDYRQVKK